MKNLNIRDIYVEHHHSNRSPGFTLFGNERGRIFADWIGHGKQVLDLGCRDGALTKFYTEGNQVVGMDIDTDALDKARKDLGIATCSFDLNGTWDIPFDSFDVVIASELIEHLYFPDKVIGKISYVLKKDGMFIGSVPNAFNLKNRVRLLLGRKKGTSLSDPTHINHFSYSELRLLLQKYFYHVEVVGFVGRDGMELLGKVFPGLLSFQLIFRCSQPRNYK